MSNLVTPQLIVTFSRISTAEGYGYVTQATLMTHNGDVVYIKSQALEHRFGSTFGNRYTKDIKLGTLNALKKFAGFYKFTVRKEISFEKEYQIMKSLGKFN